jgi:aryl-alcohol dehydrogenase-like predicted oxidoreductase
MQYRTFGRTGWQISEIGYGMWGMAGWTGSEDKETDYSLDLSVDLGCNFFDTAWGYGSGLSETILGRLIKRNPTEKLYAATKIPPKNLKWPSKPNYKLEEVFPYDHIIEYTEKSLKNLNVDRIDLQQFHVWEDGWAQNEEWQRAVEKLKADGKVAHFGISVNRWEPENCLKTLETGLIDSVQVIYNIFDQAPEDKLFPLCEKLQIGVIARVPFDEGTTFPKDDWRSTYFVPENLNASVDRADKLKPLIPTGLTLADLALRFILHHKTVSTTIPGMRRREHVFPNFSTSDGRALPPALLEKLKGHRWDRKPTEWSQ